MVNMCVQHFDLYKLLKSKLTNVNIKCLVRFGSGRNKSVQLLILSQNSGSQTIRSLTESNTKFVHDKQFTCITNVRLYRCIRCKVLLSRLYSMAHLPPIRDIVSHIKINLHAYYLWFQLTAKAAFYHLNTEHSTASK